MSLTGNVTWLAADIAEDRPEDTAELFLAGGYDFGGGWRSEVDWRYDFALNREHPRADLNCPTRPNASMCRFRSRVRFTSSATVSAEHGVWPDGGPERLWRPTRGPQPRPGVP